MTRPRWGTAAIAGAALVLASIGCTSIVGNFTVADALTGLQGQACKVDADCAVLPSTPAGCMAATCLTNQCYWTSADNDGDGHPGTCVVHGPDGDTLVGDDCVDTDAKLFPNARCVLTSTNTVSAGDPMGTCTVGTLACNGATPACEGAVGPVKDTCDAEHLDQDCNGINNDGCACIGGELARFACDASKVAKGICAKGAEHCTATGTSECEPAPPKPINCSSDADNDCDGTGDSCALQCTVRYHYCFKGGTCLRVSSNTSGRFGGTPFTSVTVSTDPCAEGATDVPVSLSISTTSTNARFDACEQFTSDGTRSAVVGFGVCNEQAEKSPLGYAWTADSKTPKDATRELTLLSYYVGSSSSPLTLTLPRDVLGIRVPLCGNVIGLPGPPLPPQPAYLSTQTSFTGVTTELQTAGFAPQN